MNEQDIFDFGRIKKAIEFITANYKVQPGLDEVAEHVHLSPYHFQRMFTEWAGVSPKRFLQYISIGHAKSLIEHSQATLSDTAYEVGLSGTGRLHDLFVKIEGMTPGEYKNGGESLDINYSFAGTVFGTVLIASTAKGVCYLSFVEDEPQSLNELFGAFPKARYNNTPDNVQQLALSALKSDFSGNDEIRLHVKGTNFQLKVWEALLKIPSGNLSTYGQIANAIDSPRAGRAVGTAVAGNPVGYLIPCHRVIRSTGVIGQYHWGKTLKTAIIGWECAKTSDDQGIQFKLSSDE